MLSQFLKIPLRNYDHSKQAVMIFFPCSVLVIRMGIQALVRIPIKTLGDVF